MSFRDNIFREYDIRGVVGRDFDADLAYDLGRAYGVLLSQQVGEGKRVGVGRDCRVSGPELAAALAKGIVSVGHTVVETGMGPTPQLYFSVFAQNLDGGIQVTGSHNPGDQNGFKLMVGKQTLSGADIARLRDAIKERRADSYSGPLGKTEVFNGGTEFLAELVRRSKNHMGPRKLKVVVDGGNGVGGMIGPDLLRALGCEIIELYTEPDGRFPNHHPDPTVLENIVELRSRVRSERADVGIAWDGDADRIGVVDEQGGVVFGDMLLLLYGQELLKEVSSPIIIGDVKCSEVLFTELAKLGARPVMWKTGHSLIKAKLKELQAHLAGEMSGHMFFVHRYFGFDDALHASARLVEILSNTEKSVSQLLGQFPVMVSTPEIRVDCPEEIKFKVSEKAKESFSEYEVSTIDGVRIRFPYGWGLVRASNTQPALVMRFEADSAERLKEYQTLVENRIKELTAALGA